ncbi:MAG: Calx-beta domain-containing protein [Verrucomicrobiia bacterium]
MHKYLCLLLTLFCLEKAHATLTETVDSFEDGELLTNPTWQGNLTNYVVTSSGALHDVQSLRVNTSNILSTLTFSFGTQTNLGAKLTEWSFLYRDTEGNPSGVANNGWRLWLVCDSTNLTSANGYAIRHGNTGTPDNLVLVRMENGAEIVPALLTNTVDPSTTLHSIRVTRSYEGLWELFITPSITGLATNSFGTVQDTTFFSGNDELNTNLFLALQARTTSGGNNPLRFIFDDVRFGFPSYAYLTITTNISEDIGTYQLTVQRPTSIGSLTVTNVIVQGTASNNVDFFINSLTNKITFNPGETLASLPIIITNNAIEDGNRTFTNFLTGPTGVQLKHIVTIIDEDPARLQFSDPLGFVGESNQTAIISVARTQSTNLPISVDVVITGGTAVNGVHYQNTGVSNLTWLAGESGTKSITIKTIDDANINADRTIILSLSNIIVAAYGSPTNHTLTILDDETTGVTNLAPGEAAIIAYNSANPDAFSIYTLTNVLAGARLRFADQGWSSSSSSWRVGGKEGALEYVVPAYLPAGSIVNFTITNFGGIIDSNPKVTSIGPAVGGLNMDGTESGFALTQQGDQLFLFQNYNNQTNFIFAYNNDSAWDPDSVSSTTSALPPPLINGSNAVAVGGTLGQVSAKYNMVTNLSAGFTPKQVLLAIANSNNWILASTNQPPPVIPPNMLVLGNNQPISDGDNTPSASDFTLFPNTLLGNNTIHTFVITNSGGSTLTISSITEASPQFAIGNLALPLNIPTNSSATFQVQFTPLSAGVFSTTIFCTNNLLGPANPYEFLVQGTGFTNAIPPPPPQTNIVTITATDPEAFEVNADTATFTVTRNFATNTPLTILYAIAGTATAGADYQPLSGSTQISANETQSSIILTPIFDLLEEGTETVELSLLPSPNYLIGSPSNAVATIEDNTSKITGLNAPFSDYNKDGYSDILWMNRSKKGSNRSTLSQAYYMSNLTLLGIGPTNATERKLKIVGSADLNHDDWADLIFQKRTPKENTVWARYGGLAPGLFSNATPLVTLPKPFRVVTAGDYNRDGYADLVLLRKSAGQNQIHLLLQDSNQVFTSPTLTDPPLLTVAKPFKPFASGYFNSDSNIDLVLIRRHGKLNDLYLAYGDANGGLQAPSGAAFTSVLKKWKPAAVGDYDGTNFTDFLWMKRNKKIQEIWITRTDPTGAAATPAPEIVPQATNVKPWKAVAPK